jgi:hypothetical protein
MTYAETHLKTAFDLTPETGGYCLDSLGSILTYVLELMKSVAPDGWQHEYLANGVSSGVPPYVLTGPHSWWFRGVSSDIYDLNSGLFRRPVDKARYPTNTSDYAALDRKSQHEYFFMTRRRLHEIGGTVWDRVFEMQHHGMPTRLLDWTFNLLTAVFFAVHSRRESVRINAHKISGYPVVWMLNPRLLSAAVVGETALNDLTYLELHGSKEELDSWQPKPPEMPFGTPNWLYKWLGGLEAHFPIVANSTNQRVVAQSGCFTLQGGSKNFSSLNKFAIEKTKESGLARFLLKFRIGPESCDDIARELQLIGLDIRFLFPEIDFASRSLRHHHGLDVN